MSLSGVVVVDTMILHPNTSKMSRHLAHVCVFTLQEVLRALHSHLGAQVPAETTAALQVRRLHRV